MRTRGSIESHRRGRIVRKTHPKSHAPSGEEAIMAMKKTIPAANPDAYVAALSGLAAQARRTIASRRGESSEARRSCEVGHLVYFSNGPTLLIRAEESRVLFGFWRGQRLRDIEPALKRRR